MIDINKMKMPALVGGVVAGILSGIPYVNVCCCLFFIGGGAIAAWMLIGKIGKIELEDGAIVGAISGVIAGVIASILDFIVIVVLMGGTTMLDDASMMGMGEVLAVSAVSGFVMMIIQGIIFVILGAIFGAIGGVIVAKIKE